MASLAAACRASARLVGSRATAARGFTTSTRCLAAQNFVMPALSPTMTEGNIASWKVKEGENFSAGDVLLEIETDKATMDVEAQEDGIMVKIMAQDGAKAVEVGSRIAVLAEAGDDINTLEIPADNQKSSSASSNSAPQEEGHSSSAKDTETKKSAPLLSNEVHEQKYPLMPSVETLVHQNGISKEDVSKIKPTGPAGRLLKGDVLAYLGTIGADRPAANFSMFEKLSHLDLSNIKVAEKKVTPPATAAKAAEVPVEPAQAKILEVNVPVSLAKVVEVQQRIQDTLGVFMPMSTFISRAAEVANEDLPPANRQPTTNELFDQVLGLDKVKATKSSRGSYLPQISAIPPSSLVDSLPAKRRAASKSNDIIDILATKPSNKPTAQPTITTVPGLSNGLNVFSLTVPKEEEQRAYMFLAQCKVILEEEPGRLVL